jgi:hypothetical protein
MAAKEYEVVGALLESGLDHDAGDGPSRDAKAAAAPQDPALNVDRQ